MSTGNRFLVRGAGVCVSTSLSQWWDPIWLAPVEALRMLPTGSVSSYLHWSWCHPSLHLTTFLPPLLHSSLNSEGEKFKKNTFSTEYSTVPHPLNIVQLLVCMIVPLMKKETSLVLAIPGMLKIYCNEFIN